MQQMMKQAKMMQKKMAEVQEELKNMEFEASAGGGAVKAKVNGDQEILEIKLNNEMIDADDLDMAGQVPGPGSALREFFLRNKTDQN